jgi:hypothetical protein
MAKKPILSEASRTTAIRRLRENAKLYSDSRGDDAWLLKLADKLERGVPWSNLSSMEKNSALYHAGAGEHGLLSRKFQKKYDY